MNIDLRLKYELKIIKEHNNIYDKLEIILNNKHGYKYNPKIKKHEKHFPVSQYISYENYIIKYCKNNKKNFDITFSISNKPIKEQIQHFFIYSKNEKQFYKLLE